MGNQFKNLFARFIIFLILCGIIVIILAATGVFSGSANATVNTPPNVQTTTTGDALPDSNNKGTVTSTGSSVDSNKTVTNEKSTSGSIDSNTKTSKTNTYTSGGVTTEPYAQEKLYSDYQNCGYIPPGYHRYGSNTCDPTQDELPITMPDPNAGLDPLSADPLWLSIQMGSAGCGTPGKLNYCQ